MPTLFNMGSFNVTQPPPNPSPLPNVLAAVPETFLLMSKPCLLYRKRVLALPGVAG